MTARKFSVKSVQKNISKKVKNILKKVLTNRKRCDIIVKHPQGAADKKTRKPQRKQYFEN